MKNILKRLFLFLLCTVLILNTCIVTVYASELPDDEREELNEDFLDKVVDIGGKTGETIWYLIPYVLTQIGFISNPSDLEQEYKNNEAFRKKFVSVWTKDNIQIKTDSNGKKSLVFSKVVADTLIDAMKDANKKPDNGGYELVKTVPVNKVSSLYFHNSVDYRSMYDLLKDNGGIMGLYYSGQNAYFYKIEPNTYYVLSSYATIANGKYGRVSLYKNVNGSNITYNAYYLAKTNEAVSSWEDEEKLHQTTGSSFKKGYFMLYDYYSAYVDDRNGSNPFSSEAYIVSSTGVSIPVFNTLKDLVAYTVANNLYYTTSGYTGEGQEITIDYDELDKILSGYYSGMYDMLQRLIEQNGGNALTPEQVQALADQVAESFDMLKTEINKGFEEQDKLIEANSNILKGIKNTLDEILKFVKKIRNWVLIDTVIDGVDLLADET